MYFLISALNMEKIILSLQINLKIFICKIFCDIYANSVNYIYNYV